MILYSSEHINTYVPLSDPSLVYFHPFRDYLHSSFRVEMPKSILCRFEGRVVCLFVCFYFILKPYKLGISYLKAVLQRS